MTERGILFSAPMVRALLAGTKTQTRRVARPKRSIEPMTDECPFGMPGDRLWVREAWTYAGTLDPGIVVYRADYPACVPERFENIPPAEALKWRPSIHMPRAASRIALEVTEVRVERLQEISEADAAAEGIQELIDAGVDHDGTPRDTYRTLWEALNGAGSWDANPFVWAVSFRRVT
jgi:hypothetical protein